MGTRYLLLKSLEKLCGNGVSRLKMLLAENQNLNIAYTLKEQFRAISQEAKTEPISAQISLRNWIQMAETCGVKKLENFA